MYAGIDNDIKDTTSKTKGLLNHGIKGVNKTIALNSVNELNSKSQLEEWIEENFGEEKIKTILSKILSRQLKYFINEWEKTIDDTLSNFAIDEGYVFNDLGISKKISYDLSSSEQISMTGIGAAVIGTLGLAAGWHTLSYAMINVFPPIAIFSLMLYPITSIITKEKSNKNKKMLVTDLKNKIRDTIITQMTFQKNEDGQIGINSYIQSINRKIIEEALRQLHLLCFSEASMNEVAERKAVIEKYLNQLEESLVAIEVYEKMPKVFDGTKTIFLENEGIRSKLYQTFLEAKSEIDIISPWISRKVMNKYFVSLIEGALNRGVKVFIKYGIGELNSPDQRTMTSDTIAQELRRRFIKYGDKFEIIKVNTHFKLLISDDEYYILGSYNFLSFSGGDISDRREEGAQYTMNPELVKERQNLKTLTLDIKKCIKI